MKRSVVTLLFLLSAPVYGADKHKEVGGGLVFDAHGPRGKRVISHDITEEIAAAMKGDHEALDDDDLDNLLLNDAQRQVEHQDSTPASPVSKSGSLVTFAGSRASTPRQPKEHPLTPMPAQVALVAVTTTAPIAIPGAPNKSSTNSLQQQFFTPPQDPPVATAEIVPASMNHRVGLRSYQQQVVSAERRFAPVVASGSRTNNESWFFENVAVPSPTNGLEIDAEAVKAAITAGFSQVAEWFLAL